MDEEAIILLLGAVRKVTKMAQCGMCLTPGKRIVHLGRTAVNKLLEKTALQL